VVSEKTLYEETRLFQQICGQKERKGIRKFGHRGGTPVAKTVKS